MDALIQSAQDMETLKKNLTTKLEALPKNQTCEYSEMPNRVWCSKYQKFAMIKTCENCSNYGPKYGTGE